MTRTEMIRTDTDVAWCAGFFDGEGSVKYYRQVPDKSTRRVGRVILCSVSQNSDNIEVLEFFQSVVGFGKILGPYPTESGNTKHVVSYGIDEVLDLLIVLKSYLKTRKTLDFQSALASYWAHDFTATSEDFAREIRRAKKKGCPECGEKWNGLACSNCHFIA